MPADLEYPQGLVRLDDVRAASRRIARHVLRLPPLPAAWSGPDRPLLLKAENLQPIGAFKLRGALNAVANLPKEALAKGIVTHSSGNHGQAVAYAAKEYGVSATVVMPDVSAQVKIDAVRALGAEVVLVPLNEREARCAALADEHGFTVIPPYDHPDVIAGQGTVGLEIVEDLPDVATVLVPVGGGGLIAGVAVAVKKARPQARVVGVEPELAGDAAESLRRGELVRWPVERRARTLADGVRTGLGTLTWAHIRELVDDIVTVSEEDIRAAVRLLATRGRLVAEPSGALTVAAYGVHGDTLPAGPTVAVISGGNIQPSLLRAVLAD